MLLTDDLQFTAPGPQTISPVTVAPVGTPGITDYWYWIVTHYPIGTTVSGPFFITNAPDTLSVANYVQVVWTASLGATSYDILRTNSPKFPQAAGNYALGTGFLLTQLLDQGQTLTSYNPAALSLVAPAFAHIHLNNRDYSSPTIEFPAGQISAGNMLVNRIQFGDGSSLTSAAGSGLSPGGPTGAVQFNNAGILGGDSGFVYTAGKVGIQTASPAYPLDVNGVEHIAGRLLIGAVSDDGNTLIQGLQTAGQNAIAINYNNASFPCQIALGTYSGASPNPGSVFLGRNARGTVAAPTALGGLDAITLIEAQGYNGISWPLAGLIGIYTEAAWSSSSMPAYITFQTIAATGGPLSERMRISSAGNVGIGTSSPTHAVDAQASANQCIVASTAFGGSAQTYGGGFSGYSARGTQAAPTATQAGDWLALYSGFGYDGSAWQPGCQLIFQANANFASGNAPGNILFYTNPGSGGVERMRLTSTGHMLMGTTTDTPDYLVSVRGGGNNAAILHVSNDGTDNGAYFQTYSGGRALVCAGAVLNSTPLWIAKNTTAIGLHMNPVAGTAPIQFFLNQSLTVGASFTPNPMLAISTSGNVGINTLTPTSKLHVVGLPTYASDTAAGTGGLTSGAFYQDSSGGLHVKL